MATSTAPVTGPVKLRLVQIIFLAVGLALFAWVVQDIELDALLASMRKLGVGGGASILLISLFAFSFDVWVWTATIVSSRFERRWLAKLFWIKMAGEAFNNGTPTGGIGGEPIKAIFLHHYFNIGYREAIASLILYKTIVVLSLVVFLAFGFAAMIATPILPDLYNKVATVGFVALSTGVVLFFLVQRFKLVSRAGGLMVGRNVSDRIQSIFAHVSEMDDRLAGFYTRHRQRFVTAYLIALVTWLVGAIEIYVTMSILGHPITLIEAVMVEVIVQLVRAGTFFIPASLGIQEGVFLLVVGTISGSPTVGLAAGLIRRFREVVWIVGGFVAFFFMRPEGGLKSVGPTDQS